MEPPLFGIWSQETVPLHLRSPAPLHVRSQICWNDQQRARCFSCQDKYEACGAWNPSRASPIFRQQWLVEVEQWLNRFCACGRNKSNSFLVLLSERMKAPENTLPQKLCHRVYANEDGPNCSDSFERVRSSAYPNGKTERGRMVCVSETEDVEAYVGGGTRTTVGRAGGFTYIYTIPFPHLWIQEVKQFLLFCFLPSCTVCLPQDAGLISQYVHGNFASILSSSPWPSEPQYKKARWFCLH